MWEELPFESLCGPPHCGCLVLMSGEMVASSLLKFAYVLFSRPLLEHQTFVIDVSMTSWYPGGTHVHGSRAAVGEG